MAEDRWEDCRECGTYYQYSKSTAEGISRGVHCSAVCTARWDARRDAEAKGSGTGIHKRNPKKRRSPAKTSAGSAGSAGSASSDRAEERPEPAPFVFTSGAALLDQVEAFIRRYCVLPTEHSYVAMTLWAVHAHIYSSFDTTPRLAFLSPEVECGKSRALEVLEVLTANPMKFSGATVSPIFRTIAGGKVTILHDEIDAVFGGRKEYEELRQLYDDGWRSTGRVIRSVPDGDDWTVKKFPAYAPVALAGVGNLPDSIISRSVIIPMRRRAPGEHADNFRIRIATPMGHTLRDQLDAWTATIATAAGQAYPEMPDAVSDRAADIWEPLLAIADQATGDWPKRAREACQAIVTTGRSREPSLRLRLLADLRSIFEHHDRLGTEAILDALREIDEAPWDHLRGESLDPRGLARMLRVYEIKSTKVKIDGKSVRGYRREDFHDAWMRYLPPAESAEPAEPAEPIDIFAGQTPSNRFHSEAPVPEPQPVVLAVDAKGHPLPSPPAGSAEGPEGTEGEPETGSSDTLFDGSGHPEGTGDLPEGDQQPTSHPEGAGTAPGQGQQHRDSAPSAPSASAGEGGPHPACACGNQLIHPRSIEAGVCERCRLAQHEASAGTQPTRTPT